MNEDFARIVEWVGKGNQTFPDEPELIHSIQRLPKERHYLLTTRKPMVTGGTWEEQAELVVREDSKVRLVKVIKAHRIR